MWHLNNTKHYDYCYQEKRFSDVECDEIIAMGLQKGLNPAEIEGCEINTKVRNNDKAIIEPSPESEWLYRKLTDCITEVNNNFYEYDLTGVEDLNFLSYNKVGHGYKIHYDINQESVHYRKLSFSLQLTDDLDYTGSDLLLHTNTPGGLVSKRERGTLNFFPSFNMHEVTPLLTGKRFSLVGWVFGPPFK